MGMFMIFAAQLLAPPACIVNNLYRLLAGADGWVELVWCWKGALTLQVSPSRWPFTASTIYYLLVIYIYTHKCAQHSYIYRDCGGCLIFAYEP